jgi:hypothetical protein
VRPRPKLCLYSILDLYLIIEEHVLPLGKEMLKHQRFASICIWVVAMLTICGPICARSLDFNGSIFEAHSDEENFL